jgi:hypothetical protein
VRLIEHADNILSVAERGETPTVADLEPFPTQAADAILDVALRVAVLARTGDQTGARRERVAARDELLETLYAAGIDPNSTVRQRPPTADERAALLGERRSGIQAVADSIPRGGPR